MILIKLGVHAIQVINYIADLIFLASLYLASGDGNRVRENYILIQGAVSQFISWNGRTPQSGLVNGFLLKS